MDIKDKHILITGGASGIGEATARHLAALGAQIILFDNAPTVHEVAKSLKATAMIVDVADPQSVEAAFAQIPVSLSVIINCAGIAPAKRLMGKEGPVDLNWFSQVININLCGTFQVMRLGVAHMIKAPLQASERGVIINTASIAAFEGQIGQIAYSASKAGVIGMTLPAARELASLGIRVMAIAPGFFDTPLLAGMSETVKDQLLAQTVFPQRLGQPKEFAMLVEQIIGNPMLNGEVIRLDGAVRLR